MTERTFRPPRRARNPVERKWWTLLAGCIATFTLLLDVTIVNVALPPIERTLGADLSDLQWVIDAYALTLAGVLLAAGSQAARMRTSSWSPLRPNQARCEARYRGGTTMRDDPDPERFAP